MSKQPEKRTPFLSDNPKDYLFRQVGVRRHPDMYIPETMTEPVFTTVEEELEMWKAAEEITAILKQHKFTIPKTFYVWHFVNNLIGLNDTIEELKWIEWFKFRATMSRIFDVMQNQNLLENNYLGHKEEPK